MRSKFVLLALAIIAAVAQPTASAHEEIFTAVLSGGAESPPNVSLGTGFATVTLDLDLFTMRVQADFSGLTGTTTAAHIHAPTAMPFMGTADVATQVPSFDGFPNGVMAGSYDHTFDMTLASSYNPAFITANGGTISMASNALFSALENGTAYLNIHTTAFGGGEIRGFFVQVPEPGSIGLLALGALALGALRYRSVKSRKA